VFAAGADRHSGALSQWAETMMMPRGFGSDWAQSNSCRSQGPSSNSGGAPWLR
jgi:hypothetical protein